MTTLTVDRPDDLGPRLREERLRQGLTQGELAQKARVGRQWLNGFEMGDKPTAPLDMVMRVLTALGVSVELRPRPARPAHQRGRTQPQIDLQEILDRTRGQ